MTDMEVKVHPVFEFVFQSIRRILVAAVYLIPFFMAICIAQFEAADTGIHASVPSLVILGMAALFLFYAFIALLMLFLYEEKIANGASIDKLLWEQFSGPFR